LVVGKEKKTTSFFFLSFTFPPSAKCDEIEVTVIKHGIIHYTCKSMLKIKGTRKNVKKIKKNRKKKEKW